MKSIYKRFLCLILALIMALGVIPSVAFTAFASEGEVTEETETLVDRTKEPVTITNGDYSLTVNKTVFEVGEPIYVSATGAHAQSWVGLYSTTGVSAGDSSLVWKNVSSAGQGVTFDLVSQYDKQEDSTFEFVNGALPEGEYIIRLFGDGSSNASSVKALVHIKVGNPPDISGEQGVLEIEDRAVSSGDPVMVSADLLYNDTWEAFMLTATTQRARCYGIG